MQTFKQLAWLCSGVGLCALTQPLAAQSNCAASGGNLLCKTMSWTPSGRNGLDTAQYDLEQTAGRSTATSAMASLQNMLIERSGNQNYAPPDQTTLLGKCQAYSAGYSGSQGWPDQCSPDGLRDTLNDIVLGNPTQFYRVYNGDHYHVDTSTDQNVLVNNQCYIVAKLGYSFLVYLNGNADHAVMVHAMKYTGTTNPASSSTPNCGVALQTVYFCDGLSNTMSDASNNGGWGPCTTLGGDVYKQVHYKIVQNGLSAGAAYSGLYLEVLDPPEELRLPDNPAPVNFMRSPGVLLPWERMDARKASDRVFESLTLADIDEDQLDLLVDTHPGIAQRVARTFPNGEPGDYYLVPLLNRERELVAQAEVDVEDGAFMALSVFPEPLEYHPIDLEQAKTLVQQGLKPGERLGMAQLEHDAWTKDRACMASYSPCYHIQAQARDGSARDIRVTLTGAVR